MEKKTIKYKGWAVIDNRKEYLPDLQYFFGEDGEDTYAIFKDKRMAQRYGKFLSKCAVVPCIITYSL